jgi:hypothetical protein
MVTKRMAGGLVNAFPSIQGPRNLFWVLTLRRVKVFETWDSPRRPIRGPLNNGPHQAPTPSSDTACGGKPPRWELGVLGDIEERPGIVPLRRTETNGLLWHVHED